MREIALYIHMPWCIKKCPYCDFNSHRLPQSHSFSRYIDALIVDIRFQLILFPSLQYCSISSIFIGGGTPSLCPPDEMARLLDFVFTHLNCSETIEVTLEANPATAESQYFRAYRQLGINRLSIGAQSFNDNMLAALGRIHCADENYRTVELARKSGFERINMDIMYALPQQNLVMALADLQAVLSCDIEHISYYELTLEENTAFYRYPPQGLPSHELAYEMNKQGERILHKHGYMAYEVSAWARGELGHCRHNVNYWKFGDYIGIGAGAHGKISVFDLNETSLGQQRLFRTQQVNNPESYMQGMLEKGDLEVMEVKHNGRYANGMRVSAVSEQELLFEYMLNRLRLTEPFSVFECSNATGLQSACIEDKIQTPLMKNLLEKVDNSCNETTKKYQKTLLGQDFLNELVWEFH